MIIMSSNEDQKKIMLKIAQFKSFINGFFIKEKSIKLIFEGLDLNLKVPDTIYLKENEDYEEMIGDSLLHLAYKENDIDGYNILICKGANFNIKDKNGNTVLHEVFSLVFSLLTTEFKTIKNPFIVSTLEAHVKHRNFNNPSNPDGLTHFHIACATNNIKAVKFFLSNGVPVNQAVISNSSRAELQGYTPLHFAVQFGHIKVVEILLTYEADAKLKDAKGKTPLHISLERNIALMDCPKQVCLPTDIEINEQIMTLLLDYNISSNALHLFVVSSMQNSFRVEHLLTLGIDVNQSISMDSEIWPGYSALHFAARVNVHIVKLLVTQGANIVAEIADGETPFDICIDRYNVKDVCDILYLVPSWKDILLSDAETKLINLLFALRSPDTVQHFLQRSAGNIKLFVPFDSPLWPGFTLLHLAVLFSERTKCKADYKYNDGKGLFDPDLTILTECLKHDADVTAKDNRNWTPIHLAFQLEKPKTIDLLLQHHHKMTNSVDEQNLSHLHIACAAKNQCIVKRLLWNDADVNIAYKGNSRISFVHPGWTPLHVAVHVKDCEIVKLLLNFGADVYAMDMFGFTPIHQLENYKYPKELNQILFNVPNLRDCVVQDLGLSYLHNACWINNVDAAKRLLDSGADINKAITYQMRDGENCKNNHKFEFHDGSTPLHLALDILSTGNKLELVRLLVERGADILIKNSRDIVPLAEIIELEKDEYVDVVFAALKRNDELRERVEAETGLTLIHLACFKFDADFIKELLDNGADINTQIHENSPIWPKYTGLHVLLSRYVNLNEGDIHVEVIKLLLDRGADVTLPNAQKDTPLHVVYTRLLNKDASYRNRLSLLLKAHKNFEVNPTSSESFSHFHIACHILDTDVVESFLEYGVDVNATIEPFCSYEIAACTPLHLAIRRLNLDFTDSTKPLTDSFAQLKIIDLLIKHGADLNAEDISGNTPVHYISCYCSLMDSPLQRFAKSGANMNAKNLQGETPLELILMKNNFTLEEIRYFVSFGCHLNAFNTMTDKGYIALANSVLSHQDMQLLLYGAIVNCPELMGVDDMNRTVIHNVVSIHESEVNDTQYVDLFDIFMEFGCDIDDQDNLGRTALHFAALFRNESAVEGLLLAGADINKTDRNGKTPFGYVFDPCLFCPKVGFKGHNQYSHLNLFNIFMRQIKRMEFCDVHVNESNESLLNKALERFHSNDIADDLVNMLLEISEITNLKVKPYSLSVMDFVSNDAIAVMDYPEMSRDKRKAIDAFFRANKKSFQEQFKKTAGILQLQHRQALLRRKMINAAKDSLTILMRSRLPDVCSHMILRLLKNFELQNLISSTS